MIAYFWKEGAGGGVSWLRNSSDFSHVISIDRSLFRGSAAKLSVVGGWGVLVYCSNLEVSDYDGPVRLTTLIEQELQNEKFSRGRLIMFGLGISSIPPCVFARRCWPE